MVASNKNKTWKKQGHVNEKTSPWVLTFWEVHVRKLTWPSGITHGLPFFQIFLSARCGTGSSPPTLSIEALNQSHSMHSPTSKRIRISFTKNGPVCVGSIAKREKIVLTQTSEQRTNRWFHSCHFLLFRGHCQVTGRGTSQEMSLNLFPGCAKRHVHVRRNLFQWIKNIAHFWQLEVAPKKWILDMLWINMMYIYIYMYIYMSQKLDEFPWWRHLWPSKPYHGIFGRQSHTRLLEKGRVSQCIHSQTLTTRNVLYE